MELLLKMWEFGTNVASLSGRERKVSVIGFGFLLAWIAGFDLGHLLLALGLDVSLIPYEQVWPLLLAASVTIMVLLASELMPYMRYLFNGVVERDGDKPGTVIHHVKRALENFVTRVVWLVVTIEATAMLKYPDLFAFISEWAFNVLGLLTVGSLPVFILVVLRVIQEYTIKEDNVTGHVRLFTYVWSGAFIVGIVGLVLLTIIK